MPLLENSIQPIAILAAFAVIALASKQTGALFARTRLPLDVPVLSVRRNGDPIVSNGYPRLRMGDVVTLLGSPAGLDPVELLFPP